MIDQLIVPLMLVSALTGAIVVTTTVIGATLYDLRAARCRQQARLHPHARHNRQRPTVTVIIPTRNNERTIIRCLDSIFASSYKKLEVLVVDNASRDGTRRLVKRYATEHPKKSVIVIARRQTKAQTQAHVSAYRRRGCGQLVMMLVPTMLLDRQAVITAVRHMTADQRIDVLTLSRKIVSAWSVIGLFQQYQSFLGQRAEKLASVMGLTHGNDCSMYRKEVFIRQFATDSSKAGLQHQAKRTHFAGDAVVYQLPQISLYSLYKQRYRSSQQRIRTFVEVFKSCFYSSGSRQKRLAWMQIIILLCVAVFSFTLPFLMSYFLYLAFSLHEPTLLLLSGAIFSLLLTFAIWDDESLQAIHKVAYSLGMPITYGLFYVAIIFRLLTSLAATPFVRKTY